MTENKLIQEAKIFMTELNHLFSVDCKLILDNNCEYGCCFNPRSNSIILNTNFINENNKLDLFYLGENYLKYFILHEYGHIVYNEQVIKYINEVKNREIAPLLKIFIQNYDSWIEYVANFYPNLDNLNCEFYWMKQYLSACEFMADYFAIKQIKSRYKNLNSNAFKLWRAYSILDRYNNCEKNNAYHFEHLNYFHIPETMEHDTITFKNDLITDLIDLSLDNSLKSLILTYNQSNNINEYNATKFSEKISGIIVELNRLR